MITKYLMLNVIKVLFYNLCQLVLIKDREIWRVSTPPPPKVFSISLHVDLWFSLVKKDIVSYKALLFSSSRPSSSRLLRCYRIWELAGI